MTTERIAAVLLAALLVVASVAAVPLGVASARDEGETDGEPDAVRPGEQLSGVVGVQSVGLDGELESRAFGAAVARAETDGARADAVAERLERDERRLEAIEDRHAELREQRDAGEMSEGEYRARVAVALARGEAVRRTAGQAASAANGVPEDLREERGVDAAAIAALQERADELTGPEVAEIARGIAGERVGEPVGVPDERPDRGQPDRGQSRGAGSNGGQSAENGQTDERSPATPTPTG